jgi:hypothetical protein
MSRSKILIVDDDVPVAGLLIELLIGEGLRLRTL